MGQVVGPTGLDLSEPPCLKYDIGRFQINFAILKLRSEVQQLDGCRLVRRFAPILAKILEICKLFFYQETLVLLMLCRKQLFSSASASSISSSVGAKSGR